MRFSPFYLYHIYNRGNNKQLIFFNRDNYLFFLEKTRKLIFPHCDILSYCLMPNHFHFLVYTKAEIQQAFKQKDIKESILTNATIKSESERHPLSCAIGILLSSHSQAINRQNGTTGSLFQQKTKAKILEHPDSALAVLHYIHQNPFVCDLVKKMEDWEFSSFSEYTGIRKDVFCNQQLAFDLLPLNKQEFYSLSYQIIEEKKIKESF
jgi:putative transposase